MASEQSQIDFSCEAKWKHLSNVISRNPLNKRTYAKNELSDSEKSDLQHKNICCCRREDLVVLPSIPTKEKTQVLRNDSGLFLFDLKLK